MAQVHATGGFIGLVCAGLFAGTDDVLGTPRKLGLVHGGGFELLGVQLLGTVAIVAWSVVTAAGLLVPFNYLFKGLRVSALIEDEGLDKHEHNIVVLRVLGDEWRNAV